MENKLRPFRPIRLNNGSLLRQGTIARNLNSGALMTGSSYLRVASGALKWTGIAGGVAGGVLSIDSYLSGNISGLRLSSDLVFGAIGFFGPIGLMISTSYYVISSDAYYNAVMDFSKRKQQNKAMYGSEFNFMERGLLCFAGGTNVTMGDGSLKPIESVMIGDTILTYDFAKERMIKTEVLRTDAPMHEDLVQISFSNTTTNSNTQDHPYFVKDKGWCSFAPALSSERYKLAVSKLEIGDKCFFYQKGKLKKVRVTSIKQLEGVVKTYNLSGLKMGNSYFANGILVNNENSKQNKAVEESKKKTKLKE